jgi:hypothetical protein
VLIANTGCVAVITWPFLWTEYRWVNGWKYRDICLQRNGEGFDPWTSPFVISTCVAIVTTKWLYSIQRRLCIKAKMPLYFSADCMRFIRVNTRPYTLVIHLELFLIPQSWLLTGVTEAYITDSKDYCLPWQLIVPQLVKKFSRCFSTWSFIATFMRSDYQYLSWAKWIHIIPNYPISLSSILILFFYLCLGIPSWLQVFALKLPLHCSYLLFMPLNSPISSLI